MKVSKYSLDGRLIEEYSSHGEAARANKLNHNKLTLASKGFYPTYHGFIWVREGETFKPFKKRVSFGKVKVDLLRDGVLIKTYPSISSAVYETGFDSHDIHRCIDGKQQHVHGYTFRRHEYA